MSPARLCVSLPARTLEGARVGIEAARRDGADLVEIRIDRWPPEEQARIGGLFPSPLPLVATYRSLAEGGEGAADPESRGPLLRSLHGLPFEAIDREVARDPPPEPSEAHRSVGSRHLAAPVDWASFPEMEVRGRADGELRKTVVPATISEFLQHLLPRTSALPEERLLVHSVGPSGPLSRVWADRLGAPWVFCAPGPHDPLSGASVEPSQVPVDRLASVRAAPSAGPLFALLGHPVRHSRSPQLHHDWMRAKGVPGAYIALDVETEREFRDLLGELGGSGFRGLNITHPWKFLARAVAHRREPPVELAGAANCLSWDGSGWVAALTDVDAAVRRLTELKEAHRWSGKELLLLGAGGSARAVLVAARRLGATARVWARRPEALEEIHRQFPETVRGGPRGEVDLVVHATSVGRREAGEFPADFAGNIGPFQYCLDFVYDPDHPTVRRWAEGNGAVYEDGTRLLRYQAEESYRRWFGELPTDLPDRP